MGTGTSTGSGTVYTADQQLILGFNTRKLTVPLKKQRRRVILYLSSLGLVFLLAIRFILGQ